MKYKLTSVKLLEDLYKKFKYKSLVDEFTLQKLVNRSMDLYLIDDDFRNQIKDWYDESPEKRMECGFKGHEFVTSDFSMMTAEKMSQNFTDHMNEAFEKWKPRKRYSIYKA
mgnify:CR=1 FL=1